MVEQLTLNQRAAGSIPAQPIDASVVELVDTPDLGSGAARREGSSPFTRRQYCGNSSVGRALPCQGRCRGFESRFPLIFL